MAHSNLCRGVNGLLSDLSKPPVNLDRYSVTDQARTARVIASAVSLQ